MVLNIIETPLSNLLINLIPATNSLLPQEFDTIPFIFILSNSHIARIINIQKYMINYLPIRWNDIRNNRIEKHYQQVRFLILQQYKKFLVWKSPDGLSFDIDDMCSAVSHTNWYENCIYFVHAYMGVDVMNHCYILYIVLRFNKHTLIHPP